MKPILMKGHERPLTFLKYNRDGDLLFSCAKDQDPTVWFADKGERLETYRGHNGAGVAMFLEIQPVLLPVVLIKPQNYGMFKLVGNCSPSILVRVG